MDYAVSSPGVCSLGVETGAHAAVEGAALNPRLQILSLVADPVESVAVGQSGSRHRHGEVRGLRFKV